MITSIHHVGCLVTDINVAIADYRKLYPAGIVSEIFDIEEQEVSVCFFGMCNMNIEFVQPANNTSTLYKMARRIPGFYHLGMVTDNIDEEITRLQNENYRKINQFNSTAFGNRSCSFLYNEEFHLIELIQQ